MAWITGNRFLSMSEMENNALMFRDTIKELDSDITDEAIAGILGNMQKESSINPGIWENLEPYWRGYGLTQWTPYTKYSNWAGSNWENNGAKETARIKYEIDNNIQWFANPEAGTIGMPVNPDMTFRQFANSHESPERLAVYFLTYYEHPGSLLNSYQERQEFAAYWYEYITGHPYAFIPRLSKNDPVPMQGNPYWYSNYNPFYATGEWGLPNCTCYAWGRWGEISGGQTLHLPTGDAGTWFPTAQRIGYYQTGYKAQLGAIICYSDPNGMGHVAVVEQIHSDGSITTSNSGYYRGSPSDPQYDRYYFHTYHSPPDYSRPGYVFQGFIYNPYMPVPPVPPIPDNLNMLFFKGRKKNDIGKSKFGNSLWNGKYI